MENIIFYSHTGSDSAADDFMEQFSREFQEDHSDLSIAELKAKSIERQRLLLVAVAENKSTLRMTSLHSTMIQTIKRLQSHYKPQRYVTF